MAERVWLLLRKALPADDIYGEIFRADQQGPFYAGF
jgi:hypothetical protein